MRTTLIQNQWSNNKSPNIMTKGKKYNNDNKGNQNLMTHVWFQIADCISWCSCNHNHIYGYNRNLKHESSKDPRKTETELLILWTIITSISLTPPRNQFKFKQHEVGMRHTLRSTLSLSFIYPCQSSSKG